MSLRELLGWWPQWCAGRMAYQKERAWKVCTTPPPLIPYLPYLCISSVQLFLSCCCCSVTQSCLTYCDRMDCSTPGFPVLHPLLEFAHSCPLSRWCHPTISPSVVLFSSCLQYFLASESFPMSRLFTSGGQRIGTTASASVLPMNIQD